MNQAGLRLLKSFEGCKLKAYRDIVGVLTIGWGHTGEDVVPGLEISQEEADRLLEKDLEAFEAEIRPLVQAPVTENQFSALVSFAYNVGVSNLPSSTLLRLLNEGDIMGASAQFERWCRAGGQIIPGLLRRRQAERALFLSPTDV